MHYQGDDARQGNYKLKKIMNIPIASQVDDSYYNAASDTLQSPHSKNGNVLQ